MAAYAAPYAAPVEAIRFVLERLVGLDELAALPGCEDATPEIVAAVLEEASKLAGQVLAPLKTRSATARDRSWRTAWSRTPDGFPRGLMRNTAPAAGTPCRSARNTGGQGLPWGAVAFAVQENVAVLEHGFRVVPAAQPRRSRGIGGAGGGGGGGGWHGTAEGPLPAQTDQRRMDRHHET